jgi:predicted ATP-dependent endonuclease of OLD family
MKLRSVTVKNFRALADVTVELDDTTVLIGENNSGETSFLEALVDGHENPRVFGEVHR